LNAFWSSVSKERSDGVTAFFARATEDILAKTLFDRDSPLAAIHGGSDFVLPSTSAAELRRVQDFLSKQSSPISLTDQAISILRRSGPHEYFDENSDTVNVRNWVSRWFPVGVEGHAYAALLMRYIGPGFFSRGPHFFQASPMFLFSLDASRLTPIASFDLENAYRFVRAEAGSGVADR
jgi:hypothetical protein